MAPLYFMAIARPMFAVAGLWASVGQRGRNGGRELRAHHAGKRVVVEQPWGHGVTSPTPSGENGGEQNGPGEQAGAAAVFELYDLRVEVVGPADQKIFCGARLGDHFELHGEMLKLPPDRGFSIYSLAALLPLLPAKQRMTDPNDWMSTDAEVACPDPHCPTRFRITRTGRRRFVRGDVTQTSLDSEASLDVPAASPDDGATT